MTDLLFLQEALLLDATGNVTAKNELIKSKDFDEIRHWSDRVYMPYQVNPVGHFIRPDSSLHALKIGSMILSRFSYGIPVHLKEFGMDSGVGMVLTTLRGNARHWVNKVTSEDTTVGETFIVDTSQIDYFADFDPQHLQLNLTFSHDYLAELYRKLTGISAPQELWESKVKISTYSPGWTSLLEYVLRMACTNPDEAKEGILGRHLEETLGVNLLLQWSSACGFDIHKAHHQVIPGYVRRAEAYIHEHAIDAPTLTEISTAVGVCSRTLSKAFRRYRNTTPMEYLRDVRLEGVRAELLGAAPHLSVSDIAYSWGYVNLGRLARAYHHRFGEFPSETLIKRS